MSITTRWAVLQWIGIHDKNGQVFLRRLHVVKTPLFGVYVHWIYFPDIDRDPHDHPWNFSSIVLRGSYVERVHRVPWVTLDISQDHRRERWSWHRMPIDQAHRILIVQPGTVTLVFIGRHQRNWGFHTDEGVVPQRQYLADGV